jgi:hypothetical protein
MVMAEPISLIIMKIDIFTSKYIISGSCAENALHSVPIPIAIARRHAFAADAGHTAGPERVSSGLCLFSLKKTLCRNDSHAQVHCLW